MALIQFFYDVKTDRYMQVVGDMVYWFTPQEFEGLALLVDKLIKIRQLLRIQIDLEVVAQGLNTSADIEAYLMSKKEGN